MVKFEFKFKSYEDFLLNAIKLEEENGQMAKLTGYYAVAVTVPEAEAGFTKNITAEIICRVDTSAYDQRVENRKKAEKLKKDMDAVIKQMDVTKKYEMYAAENPELAALLDQYKELTK